MSEIAERPNVPTAARVREELRSIIREELEAVSERRRYLEQVLNNVPADAPWEVYSALCRGVKGSR